jgi:hypothetical protein
MSANDTLTVTIDGKKRELFMPFALLNQLVKIIKDPQNVGLILIHPELREEILTEVLAERTQTGKLISPASLEDTAISLEDINEVLDWVSQHILDFTIAGLQKANNLKSRNIKILKDLLTSLTGSGDSSSRTSAASSSTPSPQTSTETSSGASA